MKDFFDGDEYKEVDRLQEHVWDLQWRVNEGDYDPALIDQLEFAKELLKKEQAKEKEKKRIVNYNEALFALHEINNILFDIDRLKYVKDGFGFKIVELEASDPRKEKLFEEIRVRMRVLFRFIIEIP